MESERDSGRREQWRVNWGYNMSRRQRESAEMRCGTERVAGRREVQGEDVRGRRQPRRVREDDHRDTVMGRTVVGIWGYCIVLLCLGSNVHEDTKNLHELLAMDPVIVSVAKTVQLLHRADRRSGVPRP